MATRNTKAPTAPVETPDTTSATDLMDEATDVAEPTQDEEVVEGTALEIIKPAGTAVATLQDYGSLIDADANSDLGFDRDDIAVPFVRVLQANSPQAKRQNPKYISGAEAGFFLNTAANAVFSGETGIDVVPVVFKRQATLWQPRTPDGAAPGGPTGGGFQGEMPMDHAEIFLKRFTKKNDKGKDITTRTYNDKPAGLELVVAAMYYCLMVDTATGELITPIAFPLTSTQMKKARAWNALMSGARLPNSTGAGSYTPPLYGFVYHVTTIPEANAKGDWMGVKITQGVPLLKYVNGQVTEGFKGAASIYEAARSFKNLVGEGRVTTKQEDGAEDDFEVVGSPAGGAGSTVEDEDDKLPF